MSEKQRYCGGDYDCSKVDCFVSINYEIGNFMKNNYLSEREMNVMQVLWKYEKPMTVTEIVESEKELTTPTVHTVLRKLLDKGYVQVIDTVQTGKVFARRYKAKKTQDEEIEEKIEKCMKNSRNPMSFVNTITAALLNGAVDEESVIDELERIVQKRKKEIL